ncbi:hypothetical protein ACJX0J_026506 [Zea mays]
MWWGRNIKKHEANMKARLLATNEPSGGWFLIEILEATMPTNNIACYWFYVFIINIWSTYYFYNIFVLVLHITSLKSTLAHIMSLIININNEKHCYSHGLLIIHIDTDTPRNLASSTTMNRLDMKPRLL